MREMFWGCTELEELDIYNFNFANVHNKQKIFFGCKKLKNINIDHNQIPYLDKENIKDCSNELILTSKP